MKIRTTRKHRKTTSPLECPTRSWVFWQDKAVRRDEPHSSPPPRPPRWGSWGQRLARHRLHIIFYTHADLIDKETQKRVARWTRPPPAPSWAPSSAVKTKHFRPCGRERKYSKDELGKCQRFSAPQKLQR